MGKKVYWYFVYIEKVKEWLISEMGYDGDRIIVVENVVMFLVFVVDDVYKEQLCVELNLDFDFCVVIFCGKIYGFK